MVKKGNVRGELLLTGGVDRGSSTDMGESSVAGKGEGGDVVDGTEEVEGTASNDSVESVGLGRGLIVGKGSS